MTSPVTPLVALLDGNVLDFLLDRPWAVDLVERAHQARLLILYATHLLDDEINAMSDPKNWSDGEIDHVKAEKWANLTALRGRLVLQSEAITGLVLDVSRVGQAKLMSWQDADRFAEITAGNPKHTEDALLILTARDLGAVLVTSDRRAKARAVDEGVEAIDPESFTMRLRAMAESSSP